jgi:hypothetical protein
MTRAVVIFARSPRAEAKAKGLPHIEWLFARVLESWIRAARCCNATPIVAMEQRGATFGERLANAAADAFAAGFETLLITGIDTPPLSGVADAFEAAERGGVAIAPSTDGGINAIVLQKQDAAILESFAQRDAQLFARCAAAFGERVFRLPQSTDIDSAASASRASREPMWRGYFVAQQFVTDETPKPVRNPAETHTLRAPPSRR